MAYKLKTDGYLAPGIAVFIEPGRELNKEAPDTPVTVSNDNLYGEGFVLATLVQGVEDVPLSILCHHPKVFRTRHDFRLWLSEEYGDEAVKGEVTVAFVAVGDLLLTQFAEENAKSPYQHAVASEGLEEASEAVTETEEEVEQSFFGE